MSLGTSVAPYYSIIATAAGVRSFTFTLFFGPGG
jgi:hypothetical protein